MEAQNPQLPHSTAPRRSREQRGGASQCSWPSRLVRKIIQLEMALHTGSSRTRTGDPTPKKPPALLETAEPLQQNEDSSWYRGSPGGPGKAVLEEHSSAEAESGV